MSGVLSRSAGLKRDIRLSYYETYANYYYLTIRSFVGYNGDCYDRYLIRMREMVESIHIILQVANKLNLNFYESSVYTSKNNNTLSTFTNNFFGYIDNVTSFAIKPLRRSNLFS